MLLLLLLFGCMCCRDAVRSARRDAGYTEPFVMDIPVTSERIRMGCPDAFVERVVGSKDAAGSYVVQSSV